MILKDIADLTGGRIIGNSEVVISGVSGITEAKDGDITLITHRRNIPSLSSIKASAIIAKEEIKGLTASILLVDNPKLTFAKVLEIFHKKPFRSHGISDKAVIGKNVKLGENISIYPHAYVSDNTVIGSNTVIFPNVYIGESVIIGEDTVVYPNVTIREGVRIGKRVIIHPGTVIGSDGFGYVTEGSKHYKMPQVGVVIIEDDVEIGSNVTIDRATTGSTVIGCGTKIDNLVQVAHNVKIGKNCIIVGQAGISGSVEIGNSSIIGGQTGIKDHIKIGDRVMIGSKSGVTHDIPDGQIISGYPSIPHKQWLRAQNIYSKLPEYIKRLNELEKIVKKEGSSHD
jgi:UDP-3-O-[3-hydroxymyristoyl] glucosamine N-acyltransferase